MNSIVIHYQEARAEGQEPAVVPRPAGAQSAPRAVDLDVRAVRALMGRIEVVLGPDASPKEVGERLARVFGIANYSYAGSTPIDNGRSERTALRPKGPARPVTSMRSRTRFSVTWAIARAAASACRPAAPTSGFR
jgi:hypothetical protein